MRFRDSIGEAYVGNRALGCSRNVVGSRPSWEGNVLQASDKLVVVGKEIVGKGCGRDESLNI
jgi:hypothetical protein